MARSASAPASPAVPPLQVTSATPRRPRTVADLVPEAARRLAAAGWRVLYAQATTAAAWHLIAATGRERSARWCVVQLLLPGADAAARHDGRQRLGTAALVPVRLGTMEQWVAHVRPDGQLAFGVDVLSGHAWRGDDPSAEALGDRLGRLAAQACAGRPTATVPDPDTGATRAPRRTEESR